jgi:hypothetical protein
MINFSNATELRNQNIEEGGRSSSLKDIVNRHNDFQNEEDKRKKSQSQLFTIDEINRKIGEFSEKDIA